MVRVLIVDDEYIMRQGLKYMIDWEQEGYEIVGEATNGNEALKLIDALQPHIIICDIVMPLMDGVDFSEVLHKMYPQIQIIILSGYDNFEYVKRTLMNGAADYILKPALNQDELIRILHKVSERIPGYKLQSNRGSISYERIIERYLLGHDKELNLEELSHCFTLPYFRIYAVNIKITNENGWDMSDILYKKVERELLGFENVQKVRVMLREEMLCIIFCYELSAQKSLLQMVEKMNGQLAVLCDRILGVYSRSFARLDELYEVYQKDIMKNVDKAFYYQGTNFLAVDGTRERSGNTETVKFDFFRYNQLLSGKQYGEALYLLQKYNDAALDVQMDVYGLKNQIKNMIYHYMDFLQLSDEEKDNYRYECFKKINQAAYEGDYRQTMETVLNGLREMSGRSAGSNDERIEKMLQYISRNYQEDLKLEDLAEEFNFNYHYLSAYFNQQMKEGFSDYLNRLRIEKACRLLEESDLSISQVSSEVGYSEHSYFCRVFKRVTGKTPSLWRRSRYYEEKF